MEDTNSNNTIGPSIVSRLEITAIGLTFVCGVLYVHGMAFHRGYMGSFGLSADAFPLSTDQVMMRGFEAYVLAANRGITRFTAISIVNVLGLLIAVGGASLFGDSILTRTWVARIVRRMQPWLFETSARENQAARPLLTEFVWRISLGLCVVVAGAVLALATATFAAEMAATRQNLCAKVALLPFRTLQRAWRGGWYLRRLYWNMRSPVARPLASRGVASLPLFRNSLRSLRSRALS